MIKIATWNLNFGSKRTWDTRALEYLLDKGVDIVLVQEMYIPKDFEEGVVLELKDFSSYKYGIFNSIPKWKPEGRCWNGNKNNDKEHKKDTQKWGTAIFSKKPLAGVSLNINTAYPGTMTIAQDVEREIGLISMYGKAINYQEDAKEYYIQNLHRCLCDVSSLFLYRKIRKPNMTDFLIAGDWNASPQFDTQVTKSESHLTKSQSHFFARLCDFGFKDCLNKLHYDENSGTISVDHYTKTFFGRKTKEDIQDDWMFVTNGLFQKMSKRQSKVDDSPEIIEKKLSDHYPIIAEFEL